MLEQSVIPNRDIIFQVINTLPDAAFCLDKNNRVVCGNRLLAELLNTEPHHLINKHLAELIQIIDEEGETNLDFFLCEQMQKSNRINVAAITKTANTLPITFNATPLSLTNVAGDLIIATIHAEKTHSLSTWLDKINNSIVNNLNCGIFISNFSKEGQHGGFAYVNDYACEYLGYTREELLKLNARTINPQGNVETIKAIGRHLNRNGHAEFDAIHLSKNGNHNAAHIVAKRFIIDDKYYLLSIARYDDEAKSHGIEESRIGRLLEYSFDEIYIFDSVNLRLSQTNSGALDNLGYSKKEITQLTITDILPDLSVNAFRGLTEPLIDGKKQQIIFEATLKRKDGTTYPVEIRLLLSHSEVPPVFLANVQDISERKRTEQHLTFLANYDSLTGLPNRSMFLDRLNMSAENSKRTETLTAVIFLDLDGFKFINDTLGHDTGDKLIIEVGKRLTSCVRKSDTVARLGGDEFTVILTNIKHIDSINVLAEKIINSIAEPFVLNAHTVQTTCSLGITIYPFADSDNAYSLIKQADTAMYQAKASGKNNYKFYESTLAANEINRRQLEHELKQALTRNEFEIHYQPRVELQSRKIIGAEALIRWKNKNYNNLSPAVFIPILETTGQIHEVDLWVMNTACQQLQQWLLIDNNFKISVNLSARQFESGKLPENLRQILQNTQVPAHNLEIEITEGVLISKTKEAEQTLQVLKEIGVSISLDDFGSGYSSLSYLKQFPIDRLKIDRSFVMDLHQNKDSTAIVEAIISLANTLKLSVTAEGIETEEQAAFLTALYCNEGQGYYFGRPMNVKQFEGLLCK